MAASCALLLAGTGVLLSAYYQPTPDRAFATTAYIARSVQYGWLIRAVHLWGARMLVVLLALIALLGAATLPGRRPRARSLARLVGLAAIVAASVATGTLLPWTAEGHAAAVALTRAIARAPFVGDAVARLVSGGARIGAATLTRWHIAHVLVLPVLAVVLIGRRRTSARHHGSVPGLERTIPPLTSAVLLLLVLSLLAILWPDPLGYRADPVAPVPALPLARAVFGDGGALTAIALALAALVTALLSGPVEVPEAARPARLLWRSSLLAGCSLLLNALILAAYLTNTPTQSPAVEWRAAYERLLTRIDPLDPRADAAELRALHARAGSLTTARCTACHPDMAGSRIALHRIHLDNELMPGLSCGDCHRRVDIAPRDNARLVSWVDVALCAECHAPFPGSDEPTAVMRAIDFEIECTRCHSGPSTPRHARPYLPQTVSPSRCKVCHGGLVLPWDEAHERDDWLTAHGAAALERGSTACFRCHDFGMKFCDACHRLTPPSHRPADRWKDLHRAAAKADTRACHTCHDLASCRRCHLSHEVGWRERHASFVRARTAQSCRRCHSTSFCTYCHTAQAGSETFTKP